MGRPPASLLWAKAQVALTTAQRGIATLRERPFLLVFVLLVLAVGLLLLNQAGLLTVIEPAAAQFVAPIQQGISRVVQGARNVGFGLADAQRLRRENEQLRTEVERLRSLVIMLKEAESENRLLRDQLGFSQANPAYDLLPAQVIGRDPDNFIQTITINKGSRDGIRPGKVVVAAGRVALTAGATAQQDQVMVVQGLVGRVIEAGQDYARVLLISDVSSAVNVIMQGTSAEGLLVGQGRGSMLLKYVRQGEQLTPGGVLLTSGLGGAFPRSLAVGIVADVQTKDQATFQTATVAPIVDLSRLDVVFVIRSFDPIRVGD